VAIELKVGPFVPEFAGKMDFYLNLFNATEKALDDNPSIGIILVRKGRLGGRIFTQDANESHWCGRIPTGAEAPKGGIRKTSNERDLLELLQNEIILPTQD